MAMRDGMELWPSNFWVRLPYICFIQKQLKTLNLENNVLLYTFLQDLTRISNPQFPEISASF